jgi:hypothetical protein
MQFLYSLRCLLAELGACVFSSFTLTTFIECSHLLTLLSNPSSCPSTLSGALVSRDLSASRVAVATLSAELHKKALLPSHVRLGYC